MLSRLKGIETKSFAYNFQKNRLATLDMLSRLKGIETIRNSCFSHSCAPTLDMLSRLKGIETFDSLGPSLPSKVNFGYAFPFEGN